MSVATTVAPPAVADVCAVIVHTVDDVCVIDEIEEMPDQEKSTSSVRDNVEQSIASSPVTRNDADDVELVEETAVNVTVGAVSSIVTVPLDADDNKPTGSTAYTLYVPSTSPDADIATGVSTDEIVT